MSSARTKLITGNTITRPADTTAYASGDLVANSTTAGSVTPFTFSAVARAVGYRSRILRTGLLVSQALLTNGTFRMHYFSSLPTVTNGDNGALDVATNLSTYLGYHEIILSALGTGQGAHGWGTGILGNTSGQLDFQSVASAAVFGLLEARAAYIPTSAMTIIPYASVDQY
jgi:hypothetical protein